MKKLALCVLGLHVAMLPCYADVIPTRHDATDAKAREAVKSRLEMLGLDARQAETHVQELTSDEIACFAQDTNRLQAASGIYWYEALLGSGVLFLIGGTFFVLQQSYVDRSNP